MVEYNIIVNDVYNRRKVELKVGGAKTVGQVKDLLIPELGDIQRSAMRLIFSGKICTDEQLVSSVFSKADASEPQNVHLIVSAQSSAGVPRIKRQQSATIPSPDFLSLDTQGSELEILKGEKSHPKTTARQSTKVI